MRIKGKVQKGHGNETGHQTQNLAEVSKTAGNVNKTEMAQVDELCFDNLDEFINDENKLVTYKWLSRSLSIHVNQAKQILYQFLEQQRNEKNNKSLSVTYFICGLCQQNDSLVYKGQIVPEQDLEATKLNYTQLTSCHVYSVQKGKLKDSNSLYIADYDMMKEHLLDSNRFSSISCPSAKLYKDEEVEEILQIKSTSESPVKQKFEKASKEAPPKEKKAKKPDGIAGMFAKSAKKHAETSTSSNEPPEKDVSSKTKNKSKSDSMMKFFSKQVTPKSEQVSTRSESSQNENKKKDEPQQPSSSEVSASSNSKKGKKKMMDSDEEEPVRQEKKRRRIRQISTDTSSSEDEMEVEEPVPSPPPPPPPPTVDSDSDEIPPTPSPESPSTKPGSGEQQTQSDNNTHGKIRKRKLVTKTYVDNDGMLITEKVYEDEWVEVTDEKDDRKNVTHNDEKTEVKTKKSSTAAKKVSPAGRTGRKQTALTSFFSKK